MSPREQSGVYLLSEPELVDVPKIEQELVELWRGAAAEGREAVLHAAAFTLVYATATGDHKISELIAELTLAHPARAILLQLGDAERPSQRAWVTAYCHRPPGGAQQVCSEFITLECLGEDAASMASLLFALRLPGLPLVLVWDESLPAGHPLLPALRGRLERAIVATVSPGAPASRLEPFFHLRDVLGTSTVLTDLVESRLRPWQLAVARLFDADPAAAQAIHEIRLHYAPGKIPAHVLLLAAWLSAALEWKPLRVGLHGSDPIVTFEHQRRIVFDSHSAPADRAGVEFHVNGDQAGRVLRVVEPPAEERLPALLLSELNIWGHDRLRLRYLARARQWLKEILFL